MNEVRAHCRASTPGVEAVLGRRRTARSRACDHERSGDLVAVAAPDAWFTYYYWLDDRRAPDYARTVDIHRKPGYDPVELFLDPAITRADADDRVEAGEAQGRLPHAAGRHSAGRHARQRLARTSDGMGRGRTGVHQRGKGSRRLDENHFS